MRSTNSTDSEENSLEIWYLRESFEIDLFEEAEEDRRSPWETQRHISQISLEVLFCFGCVSERNGGSTLLKFVFSALQWRRMGRLCNWNNKK